MNLLPGHGRKRARLELEQQLRGIIERLELLESAPTSRSTELAIERHVSTQLAEVSKKLTEVAYLAAGVHEQGLKLGEKVDGWTLAISEGIERTERAERRVRAAIARAKKELAEHGFESPGLEAEAAELRLVDGSGGQDGGLPDVPEAVEPVDSTPSSIKGVSAAHLRRVRGW